MQPITVLRKEQRVQQLAARYGTYPNEPWLLLMNPKTNIGLTTFVHELFRANKSAKTIIDYLEYVEQVMGSKNEEFFKNYLVLSDDDSGKAILDLIRHNPEILTHFQARYRTSALEKLLSSASAVNLNVDTHTASVHASVDQSFVRLAKRYCELSNVPATVVTDSNKKGMVGRKVSVERTQQWTQAIDSDLTKLQRDIQILDSDDVLKKFLEPTLAAGEELVKVQQAFRFKVETASRLINDILTREQFGKNYIISPKAPNTCGLTLQEMVAIGYRSIFDDSNMQDRPSADVNAWIRSFSRHLINFIENLYKARRGYNIDRNFK